MRQNRLSTSSTEPKLGVTGKTHSVLVWAWLVTLTAPTHLTELTDLDPELWVGTSVGVTLPTPAHSVTKGFPLNPMTKTFLPVTSDSPLSSVPFVCCLFTERETETVSSGGIQGGHTINKGAQKTCATRHKKLTRRYGHGFIVDE